MSGGEKGMVKISNENSEMLLKTVKHWAPIPQLFKKRETEFLFHPGFMIPGMIISD